MRPWESDTLRSAEPEPWAIQVPRAARTIGSRPTTIPLAGRIGLDCAGHALVQPWLAVGDHDDLPAAGEVSDQLPELLGVHANAF